MSMSSSDIVFWGRALQKYLNILVYTHNLYKELFSKTQSTNLGLTIETHLLEWRLPRFGKEHFKYVCASAYMSKLFVLQLAVEYAPSLQLLTC